MDPGIELVFAAEDFRDHYERKAFYLRHNLAGHPLFSLDALIDLANRLPPEFLEFNAGDVPASLRAGKRASHQLSAAETIRRIRDCSTWLGLKRIEQIPEYRAVVENILSILRPHIDPSFPGMRSIEAFVFVTSPNSTVPFHMDPEHNFLFQLQGRKHFITFPRDALREQDFERHYLTWERRMELSNDLLAAADDLILEPGQAIHVPINSPHYVRNDDEISVSVSITFQTPAARRREMVYKINGQLRKLGLKPTPFAVSPARDKLKIAMYNWLVKIGIIRLSGRRT